MSTEASKPGQQSKAGHVGLPAAVAPNSQSVLLEKLNVRRSTPDSEALASSDDEADAHWQEIQAPTQTPKPVRRTSWLNGTSQPMPRPRKDSFASSTISPTTSHPSTPAMETGISAWGSHANAAHVLGRGHTGAGSYPWGTGIWTSDRKDPPSRLTEVLSSPTSVAPGSSFFNDSPVPREQVPNSQIPFAIPLHPTPKTYRSQSYSVGQLDPESTAISLGSSVLLGNRRPGQSGLQHRPSRPSMLSEVASDGSMLGKVNEDEDDGDENGIAALQANKVRTEEAKTIEMLTRENAMLRQQHQYQSSRLRPRASTGASFGLASGYMQESVPEESEYAIDELDETNDTDVATRRTLARRMSEFGAAPYRASFSLENRKLENVKKAFWQSSLGFGGLGEIPQSRRHSFADMPTRQGSISFLVGDAAANLDSGSVESAHPQEYSSSLTEAHNYHMGAQPLYFAGGGGPQVLVPPIHNAPHPSPYIPLHGMYANRPTSPHRSMYGMAQPRHSQCLHIVLFKCSRAEVFYIQEVTGLTVKPGDLVIVEADRGTDLGTVARDSVDWQQAKEIKEHYAEEHYKWLMMYSHNAAAAQEGTGAGLMAASNVLQGGAVGGMGPPSQYHLQEASPGELKPKLIKRLAQAHEIVALRDKEGNEAKAKRVCMQKVKEHGLSMEILDAEFQMDWKKLTFYYFADSYINFNSLVTDLFKIYKTRIWMSAINPASFASPTLGLQAPSGIGPGAVGVGRGTNAAERRQTSQETSSAQTRNATPKFTNPFAPMRTVVASSTFTTPAYPCSPYAAFGNGTRLTNAPFPGTGQALEGYASAFPPAGDVVGTGRGRIIPGPRGSQGSADPSEKLPGQSDWLGSFQDLSLNTR